MEILIPAPEEVRTFKEFIRLFKERNKHVKDLKKELLEIDNERALQGRPSLKSFFDISWQEPEAEEYFRIYNE